MTKILDTNVLIRHFTGQPPELAHRATEYLSKARPQELLLLDLHVAECVYVLEGSYPRSKPETSRLINSLVGFAAIQFEREEIIQRALNLYLDHNMDFGDAYLVAAAEHLGISQIVSFDRFDAKLARASVVCRVEP